MVHSVTGQELGPMTRELGPMPSVATQNNMTFEMKSLSRQQVAEAPANTSDTTLKYNGKTKKLGHLVETEIAT